MKESERARRSGGGLALEMIVSELKSCGPTACLHHSPARNILARAAAQIRASLQACSCLIEQGSLKRGKKDDDNCVTLHSLYSVSSLYLTSIYRSL